jgi:hypothetical protein
MNNLIYTPSVQREADSLMASYRKTFPTAITFEIVRACIFTAKVLERKESDMTGNGDTINYTSEYYQEMIKYLNAQL